MNSSSHFNPLILTRATTPPLTIQLMLIISTKWEEMRIQIHSVPELHIVMNLRTNFRLPRPNTVMISSIRMRTTPRSGMVIVPRILWWKTVTTSGWKRVLRTWRRVLFMVRMITQTTRPWSRARSSRQVGHRSFSTTWSSGPTDKSPIPRGTVAIAGTRTGRIFSSHKMRRRNQSNSRGWCWRRIRGIVSGIIGLRQVVTVRHAIIGMMMIMTPTQVGSNRVAVRSWRILSRFRWVSIQEELWRKLFNRTRFLCFQI